ncbi:LysR family transcriptional regulator [Roseinatronobacter sp. HJB301]|uniref:LysR family transcriptional regulator n=2 Tax=Roseinatronobacter alkalisoli TaxID=3028235 RepID=A0ABT5T858_9RHOB|nr:LysR family transcriptional regulator [Roseinatronobacter sp. HJB301]MDD7971310.1 LysR family transcriptional regulator [Roseinatronobacter sp. HJB301]
MRYTLDEIETFLTVMELGTVTAAAAHMNLSKSVISKRISDLERALQAALFLRNAGRVTPTEAALRLAEQLRPALTALTAATESASWGMDGAAPLRGRLSITAPMSFGTLFLSPILARFALAHPGLELRIDYDDRARDLVRDGFDLAVRIGDSRDNALIGRTLCTDQMIACASPDYLARHGHPATPADLAGHQVLSYSHLPDGQLWQFAKDGKLAPAPVRSCLTLNNGETMRDFALAGLGLAMLPGFIVADPIAAGRLEPVLPGHATRKMPVLALWPPISPMPAKLRTLVDHLALELAGGRPWTDLDG